MAIPGRARSTLRALSWPGAVGCTPASWTITAVLAGCWLAAGPRTPDLAAQVHRASLFAAHGFALWDNSWYGGHHLPDYSLVFPPLASLLGLRITAATAAVGSAALFESLVGGPRAAAACRWFAVGCVVDLLIGRLAYAVGVTAGLAAVAALMRGRLALAGVFAALCAATSPVAGLFLALAGVGIAIGERRRRGVVVTAVALATVGALSMAFPEGGTQPFSTSAFAVTVAIALAVAVAVGRGSALRPAALLYVAAVGTSFVIPSPMGANVMRLGAACAGPLLLFAASTGHVALRRAGLLALLVVVAAWQWVDPVTQVTRAWGDPSSTTEFYRPLVARLRRERGAPGRIEVPFTRGHWESVYLARRFALARGWERQLDRRLNPLFYRRRLDASAYRRWLRVNAVRYVALPDAVMDPAGRQEAALVAARPSFLEPVWRGAGWQLFRTRDPLPLATGAARRVRLDASDVRVGVDRPGTVLVRVHWTPYWRLVSGSGCLARHGPWTVLDARRPGTYVLAPRLSLGGLLRRPRTCSPRAPRRDDRSSRRTRGVSSSAGHGRPLILDP
jgi:hypothetical protein